MSLSQALSTAMSGLRATQAALVAGIVERRQCGDAGLRPQDRQPGRRPDRRLSARACCINGVNRELDQYLQTQLRTETSGAAYADIRSTYLANLQSVYGNPGDTGTHRELPSTIS